MDHMTQTEVVILTPSYRITGRIALVAGARLTDYITDAKSFIAVIEAEIATHDGKLVQSSPFINVNRSHVEVIFPANLAKKQED